MGAVVGPALAVAGRILVEEGRASAGVRCIAAATAERRRNGIAIDPFEDAVLRRALDRAADALGPAGYDAAVSAGDEDERSSAVTFGLAELAAVGPVGVLGPPHL